MKYKFKPMDEDNANIIANWHYEGIYKFYDFDQDVKDMEDLLNPQNWTDCYYIVKNEKNELIGFFSFYRWGKNITIGLGLRPDLTGKRLGESFFNAGLEFAKKNMLRKLIY